MSWCTSIRVSNSGPSSTSTAAHNESGCSLADQIPHQEPDSASPHQVLHNNSHSSHNSNNIRITVTPPPNCLDSPKWFNSNQQSAAVPSSSSISLLRATIQHPRKLPNRSTPPRRHPRRTEIHRQFPRKLPRNRPPLHIQDHRGKHRPHSPAQWHQLARRLMSIPSPIRVSTAHCPRHICNSGARVFSRHPDSRASARFVTSAISTAYSTCAVTCACVTRARYNNGEAKAAVTVPYVERPSETLFEYTDPEPNSNPGADQIQDVEVPFLFPFH